MSELQSRIVPLIVDYPTFWTRYFYQLHKLELKHEQFKQLTRRATQPVEEEVGWDDDDQEEEEEETPKVETAAEAECTDGQADGEDTEAGEPEEQPRAEQAAGAVDGDAAADAAPDGDRVDADDAGPAGDAEASRLPERGESDPKLNSVLADMLPCCRQAWAEFHRPPILDLK